MELIAQNKKARHDYFLVETMEAGIVLKGSEIKSIRDKKANIQDAYIIIKEGEAFILNMHISKYEFSSIFNHDETRTRKILLHKKQIAELSAQRKLQNMTIIPTKLYIKDGLAKLEIALAKGKKLHDKRHDLAKKDADMRLKKIQGQRSRYDH